MTGIIRPRVWTQQPQYPVEIDWSNPLTHNLGATYIDGVDAVSGRRFSPLFLGKLTHGVGRHGKQVSSTYDGVNAPNIRAESISAPINGPVTLFALANVANIRANGIISLGDASIGTYGIGLKTSSSGDAYHRAFGYINSTTPIIATSSVVPDGNWHLILLTWDGASAIKLYLDGALKASTTGLTTLYGATDFIIGNFATSGFSGDIAFAGYARRELTSAEAQSLSANPWQIFRPRVT